MRSATICVCDSLQAIPYLASREDEIVIRIDHEERRDRLVTCRLRQRSPLIWGPSGGVQRRERGPNFLSEELRLL